MTNDERRGTPRRDKLGIAVVGLNFGGHIVRNELMKPPTNGLFRLVAVADMDGEKAQKTADELNVRSFRTLDDVLADPEVDVVGLYTGPAGRAELLRRIIRAGKDVMTTKPFELDAGAALAVLREAKELGRVIHLNSPSALPSDDLRQILAWRERYDLGRPVGGRFEAWAAYNEQADGKWYDDPALCPVAPVFRIGIYLINDALRLFGEPECVSVFSSRIRTGRPTADNGQLAIKFRNGALVNIFASLCVGDGQFWRNTASINYERGTIYRNPPPSPHEAPTKLILVRADRGLASVTDSLETASYSGAYDWASFHRAVRGEKLEGEVSPEQIVMGIRVVNAMARAETSGCCEKVMET
jgi:predicted dehydrogenase